MAKKYYIKTNTTQKGNDYSYSLSVCGLLTRKPLASAVGESEVNRP